MWGYRGINGWLTSVLVTSPPCWLISSSYPPQSSPRTLSEPSSYPLRALLVPPSEPSSYPPQSPPRTHLRALLVPPSEPSSYPLRALLVITGSRTSWCTNLYHDMTTLNYDLHYAVTNPSTIALLPSTMTSLTPLLWRHSATTTSLNHQLSSTKTSLTPLLCMTSLPHQLQS